VSNQEAFVSSNPVGEIQADQIFSNISLVINKENFTVNLVVLESLDIPVVLGNGWLCAHKGVIYGTQWRKELNITVVHSYLRRQIHAKLSCL